MTTMTATFTFNKDYNDLEQVRVYFDAYMAVFEALAADGKYPYNSSFKGQIEGLVADDKNEDTAIYLLQGLRMQEALDAKVAELIDAGYEHVIELKATTKYRHVFAYPTRRMGGDVSQWRECRLVPRADGSVYMVLPKGL
jgi:hypothetical protein